MLFFLSLVAGFKLEGEKRSIFTADGSELVLHFDRKHIVGGNEASNVTFSKSEGKVYSIKFDGVSMCPNFSRMTVVGCDAGKWWNVSPNGPYFKISARELSSGKEYCWIRSHKSRKNKIRLGVCGSSSADFRVEDKDTKVPKFKKFIKKAYTAVKNFFEGLFGKKKKEKEWDSESVSSSKEESLAGESSAKKDDSDDSSRDEPDDKCGKELLDGRPSKVSSPLRQGNCVPSRMVGLPYSIPSAAVLNGIGTDINPGIQVAVRCPVN